MDPDQNISVEPEFIFFKQTLTKPQTTEIKLTNMKTQHCMYKVLATNPALFKVKNHVGMLKPNESAIAIIKLDACKSKQLQGAQILVQSGLVDKDVNRERFWQNVDEQRDNIQFLRLNVTAKEPYEEPKARTLTNVSQSPPVLQPSPPPPPQDTGLIQTDPRRELIFRGPFTDITTSVFTVYNKSQRFVYIRILINDSDFFRIRPVVALIPPMKNSCIAVMLKKLSDEDESKAKTKEFKIRLEYVDADNDKETAKDFWRKDMPTQATKLRIALQNDD